MRLNICISHNHTICKLFCLGINCQYLEVKNNCGEHSHENYTCQQDEIGTPYAVTLEDSTLTNGIVTLRNRDTTLSEFLHLSEILKTVQRHLDGF